MLYQKETDAKTRVSSTKAFTFLWRFLLRIFAPCAIIYCFADIIFKAVNGLLCQISKNMIAMLGVMPWNKVKAYAYVYNFALFIREHRPFPIKKSSIHILDYYAFSRLLHLWVYTCYHHITKSFESTDEAMLSNDLFTVQPEFVMVSDFSIIAICLNPMPLYNVKSVGRAELLNHFIFKRAALLYYSGGLKICLFATHKNFL